jgi:hypothetical protein
MLGALVNDWAEWSVEPGIEGDFDLGSGGVVYGRLSGVGSWTRVGLDAAGSNLTPRRPGNFRLEDAYLGWRSGDLFPSLGKDAVDLSLGAQDYQVGSGFLWWNGSTNGGRRGAFWISPSSAFAMTGIARLTTGPFSGEAVWLTPNDKPDSDTQIVGVNGAYAFSPTASLGLGYWYLYASDDAERDGLHVIDLRGSLAPLPSLPELVFAGEIAHEKNGRRNDSWGGYAEAGYTFLPCAWEPHLGYRFSLFTGGDPGKRTNHAFDPLFNGSDNWGEWAQGELIGQYVAENQNLAIHQLRARARPIKSLSLNLLYYHYQIEDRTSELLSPVAPHAGNIEHRNFGDEVDFVVDWSANPHLDYAAVLAVFEPAEGGRDFFGNGATWLGFMLSATLHF